MKKYILTIIFYCLFTPIVYSQSNRQTYSYAVNSSKDKANSYNIMGTVLLKKSNKVTGANYIILVIGNTTYKVIIKEKSVFELIKEREVLILNNCKLLKQLK